MRSQSAARSTPTALAPQSRWPSTPRPAGRRQNTLHTSTAIPSHRSSGTAPTPHRRHLNPRTRNSSTIAKPRPASALSAKNCPAVLTTLGLRQRRRGWRTPPRPSQASAR
jgi:hypothetical protein